MPNRDHPATSDEGYEAAENRREFCPKVLLPEAATPAPK